MTGMNKIAQNPSDHQKPFWGWRRRERGYNTGSGGWMTYQAIDEVLADSDVELSVYGPQWKATAYIVRELWREQGRGGMMGARYGMTCSLTSCST